MYTRVIEVVNTRAVLGINKNTFTSLYTTSIKECEILIIGTRMALKKNTILVQHWFLPHTHGSGHELKSLEGHCKEFLGED